MQELGRIIDQMTDRGIISGYQGSKPREVLMSKERGDRFCNVFWNLRRRKNARE